MSKLDDFIADSREFQGKVLQQLADMDSRHTTVQEAQTKKDEKLDARLALVEKGQWKVAAGSGIIGFASGLLANLWGTGQFHK